MFLWAALLDYLLPIAQVLLGAPAASMRNPSDCLTHSSNLDALVTCFDTFTAPHDYYTPRSYAVAQPTPHQRTAWAAAVRALLAVESAADCLAAHVPPALQGVYAVAPFRRHCVLHEVTARCGTYAKGWGFLIVPADGKRKEGTEAHHALHVSAPHPGYDLGTVEQAAAVYEAAGGRSLLVAGRTRTAFLAPSGCIAGTGRTVYYMTDPAHNDQEPFFDANAALYDWQRGQPGGCTPATCAFLQLHGKGAATCPRDTIFLSAGLANSTAAQTFYRLPYPATRLSQSLGETFPSYTIALPPTSPCLLTATRNVVGRYLNGVPRAEVCVRAARVKEVSGVWVHAEQAGAARAREAYKRWGRAVLDAMGKGEGGDDVREIKVEKVPLAEVSAEVTGREEEWRRGREEEGQPRARSAWYIFMCYLTMGEV